MWWRKRKQIKELEDVVAALAAAKVNADAKKQYEEMRRLHNRWRGRGGE